MGRMSVWTWTILRPVVLVMNCGIGGREDAEEEGKVLCYLLTNACPHFLVGTDHI